MRPFRPPWLVQHALLLLVGYFLVACSMTASESDAPPAQGEENEEEGMMAVLAQAATMPIEAYNPATVIEAVNALHPLGKEGALAEVERFLHQQESAQATGLFWVLRVLFEVPDEEGFPPLRLGQPAIPPPDKPSHLPRFPIVIVQDVPLLASRGYFLAGLPEPVEAHVAYYREHGTLREAPLTPPATAQGLEAQFLEQWQAVYGQAHAQDAQTLIREQLARLYR